MTIGDEVIHVSNFTAIKTYGYSIRAAAIVKRIAAQNCLLSDNCITLTLIVPGGIDPMKLKANPMINVCSTCILNEIRQLPVWI